MPLDAADSSRSSLAITPIADPAVGLDGTEVFKLLRNTGNSLVGNITSNPNEEIRPDYQVSGSSQVSASNGGDINFQLSYGEYDELLEAVLGSEAWTTFTSSATTFTSTTKTISGMATTVGLVPEQVIKITLATNAGNNGLFTVATVVDGTSITVHEVLIDEAASGASLNSSMISNGTVKREFAVEEAYQDTNDFWLSEGLRVGSMKFSLANSQIGGSFSLMGTGHDGAAASVSVGGIAAYTPSLANDVMNGSSGIGNISIRSMNTDGSLNAAIAAIFESLEVTMDITLREQTGLGSLYPLGIGRGNFTASLSSSLYFQNRDLYNNFKANDVMVLRFSITDDGNDITAGNSYHFSFPGIRIGSNTSTPESQNTDIMEKVSMNAVIDPYLTLKTCIISRIPAP